MENRSGEVDQDAARRVDVLGQRVRVQGERRRRVIESPRGRRRSGVVWRERGEAEDAARSKAPSCAAVCGGGELPRRDPEDGEPNRPRFVRDVDARERLTSTPPGPSSSSENIRRWPKRAQRREPMFHRARFARGSLTTPVGPTEPLGGPARPIFTARTGRVGTGPSAS